MKKLDSTGYKLIQEFEGLKLSAYRDSAGIPTIGYGNITYQNGKKVKMGDTVTKTDADVLFQHFADEFASKVNDLVKSNVNQNQFNALVSLAYNIGIGALGKSTILKKVNLNPNDATIRTEFLKWVNAGSKKIQGLVNRRNKEADLYFKK